MNNSQQYPQQPPKLKVDINQLEIHKCRGCGNTSFITGIEIRILPILLSGTGKLEIVNVPIAICSVCGIKVIEDDLKITGHSKASEGQA